MAPRNGGVTNDAVTSARTVRRSGMSVRATSQPIGAATAQQMTADEVARMTVVKSGLVKVGSVTSVTKFCSVKPPALSVTLKYTSHDIGSTISATRIAANAIRIGQERSSRVGRSAGRAGTLIWVGGGGGCARWGGAGARPPPPPPAGGRRGENPPWGGGGGGGGGQAILAGP